MYILGTSSSGSTTSGNENHTHVWVDVSEQTGGPRKELCRCGGLRVEAFNSGSSVGDGMTSWQQWVYYYLLKG